MIAGEPETQNPSEDYVAASGVGWSDRPNEWTRTVGDKVVEPSGFLCQTGILHPVKTAASQDFVRGCMTQSHGLLVCIGPISSRQQPLRTCLSDVWSGFDLMFLLTQKREKAQQHQRVEERCVKYLNVRSLD